jgi:hypothetical protein
MDKNPDTRLGARHGPRELRGHPFFADIDWAAIDAGTHPVPLETMGHGSSIALARYLTNEIACLTERSGGPGNPQTSRSSSDGVDSRDVPEVASSAPASPTASGPSWPSSPGRLQRSATADLAAPPQPKPLVASHSVDVLRHVTRPRTRGFSFDSGWLPTLSTPAASSPAPRLRNTETHASVRRRERSSGLFHLNLRSTPQAGVSLSLGLGNLPPLRLGDTHERHAASVTAPSSSPAFHPPPRHPSPAQRPLLSPARAKPVAVPRSSAATVDDEHGSHVGSVGSQSHTTPTGVDGDTYCESSQTPVQVLPTPLASHEGPPPPLATLPTAAPSPSASATPPAPPAPTPQGTPAAPAPGPRGRSRPLKIDVG